MGKRPVDFSALKALSFITQAGLSFCVPLVLCIWGASVLCNRFQWGNGAMLAGVLIGLYAGISSFVGILRAMNRMAQQRKEEEQDG